MAKVSAPLYKIADDIIMTPLSTESGALWTTSETRAGPGRSSLVQKISRKFSMVVVIVVAALAVLALVTQAGVFLSERAHPAQGRMVEVAGGDPPYRRYRPARRGRSADRDAPWRELQSRGDAAAGRRAAGPKAPRDPDRPSRAWLEHARPPRGLDARNPGPHDRRGAGKARRRQRDLRGAFLGRRAGRAHRAGLSRSASPVS